MEYTTQDDRAVGQEFIDLPCLDKRRSGPQNQACAGLGGAAIAGDQEPPTHMSRSGNHTHTDAGGVWYLL